MTLGQWLGQWQGSWAGSGEPAPEGFVSGTSLISVSGVGVPSALVNIQGASTFTLESSGAISTNNGTPIVVWLSGAATIAVSAHGSCNEEPEIQNSESPSAGGAGNDSGTGYVWKDHAWVKATKVVKVGISKQYAVETSSRVEVVAVPRVLTTKFGPGEVLVTGSTNVHPIHHRVRSAPVVTNSNSHAVSNTSEAIVSRYNGACDTLSLDELLILLEIAA